MGSIAQQSPVPRGGASLIVAWSIASRHILVVGGSDAAASRVFFALEADAQVHVVAPKTSLSPALIGHIDRREVTYYDREFEQRDLHDKSMVFVASEDASLAKHIAALCRMGRIPVNIADQPDLSDFWLTSTYRDHALQIAVSTNGNGPKIATRLRKHIAATLPEGSGLAIQRLGVLRQKLRAADPSDKSASRRLAFINKLSEAWPLQKLAELTNGEIDQLVQIYLAGREQAAPFQVRAGSLKFVAAGSGSVSGLTTAAYHAIVHADVVLADDTVSREVLALVAGELVLVPTAAKLAEVEEQLSSTAAPAIKTGKDVVVLKSGFYLDPKEAAYAEKIGIAAEIVPGFAAEAIPETKVEAKTETKVESVPVAIRSAYTGTQPLTIPAFGPQKAVITCTYAGRGSQLPAYVAQKTFVFFLTASSIVELVSDLRRHYFTDNLPLTLVERGAHRPLKASIGSIVVALKNKALTLPAAIIIGEGAHLLDDKIAAQFVPRSHSEPSSPSTDATASPIIAPAISLDDAKPAPLPKHHGIETLLSGEEAVAHVAYGLSDLSFVYKVAPEGYLGQPLESLAKDSTPNAFHKSHKNLALSTREGAATAVHGALAAGAAVTTVTSSEALPLMIPAMYGIAAERKAVVFHVGSQAITSDLGVVSDYSDVLAASYTGFAFIGSSSVQEAHDLSLVAHLASSVAHQPVLHFFDGARVAKETAKTFVAPYHELSSLTRAIAHRHAAVPPVERFPEVVQEVMHELAKFFGHEYKLFEYVGAHDAESVIVTLGPASNVVETAVEHARQHGSKVGVLKIRLLRPWSAEHFVAAIPKTAKRIVVVEQATAAGTHGPLYLDVTGSFYSGHWTSAIPAISKAHFQAGVEHFHPAAVSAFLAKLSSSRRAPRIIELSAADVQKSAVADGVHQAVFWDAQEQGTAKVAQAVAQYIASESFGTVQSHTARDDVQIEPLSSTSLRYSKTHTAVNSHRVQAADYVAIHDVAAVERYNPIVAAKTGATVVINSAAATAAELEKELSDSVRAEIARKQLKVHVVDAQKYAKKFTLYLGKSTEYVNLILAAVFYKLAPAVDTQHALEHIFAIVRKTETHASIVQTKIAAVHQALDSITHIHVPAHWASATLDATLLTSVQGSLALPKTSAPSEEREQITRVVPSHRAAWSLLFREAYKTDKKLRPDVDNAFLVKVTENRRLTPVEYDRNVFHIEMDTTGTGLRYEIGEALGVHGHNSDEDVKTFIKFYGLDPREIVVTERVDESGKPSTEVRTVEQILTQVLDIFGKPGKKFYSSLAEFATDIKEREHLNTIASADGADELKRLTEEETVTFADILERFPSAHPSIEDLVKLVPAIKPRHYSISSSQNMHPDSVHLLVVLVDWRSSTGKTRVGQCTRYLNSLKVGQALTVTIKPSVMKLPKSLTAPVIMSGLGTGMAPFRAFIEERFYWKSQGMEVGPMVLYFGSRNRANEYLYGEELEAYHADGVLSRLQLAFSRDQKKKIYIQHKIAEDADLLAKYILKDEGAFYLCGPTWPVPDVKDALVGAFTAAGTTVERANELLEELKEQDRYILEVY